MDKDLERKNKILLFISCSKSKLSHPAPAKQFYTGQLFRSLVKLAQNNQWDVRVLSGKYGLIPLTKIVEPYDQKIQTQDDIERIQNQAIPKLQSIIPNYKKIIVFMSKTYRKVLKPLILNAENSKKFIVIHHRKGIFGYKKLVYECSKLLKPQVISYLEQFDGLYSEEHKDVKKKESTIKKFL